ncbi:MAG: hypothetical protein H7Y32_18710 [Chloroflexales bacterium]|nr:hypothetical protein [Chloroflexales bacterium]
MAELQREKVTTTGMFADEAAARHAVEQLRGNGYSQGDVQVVAEEQQPERNEPGEVSAKAVTKSRQGFLVGLIAGALIGAAIGFFLGQPGGVLAGVELVQFLGPFAMAALIATMGAALGILAGTMTGLGQTRQEAKGLAKEVQQGYWLVSLRHTDPNRAAQDLRGAGAIDVRAQSGEARALKSEA